MDMEHVSPATRLLEKRRRMFEVNEQLERQKQQFERQEVLILSSDTFYVWFGYAQVRARVQFRFLIVRLDTFININFMSHAICTRSFCSWLHLRISMHTNDFLGT